MTRTLRLGRGDPRPERNNGSEPEPWRSRKSRRLARETQEISGGSGDSEKCRRAQPSREHDLRRFGYRPVAETVICVFTCSVIPLYATCTFQVAGKLAALPLGCRCESRRARTQTARSHAKLARELLARTQTFLVPALLRSRPIGTGAPGWQTRKNPPMES